jgi:hypothetical protein
VATDPENDPNFTNLLREAEETEHAADDAEASARLASDANRDSASVRAKMLRTLAKAQRATANQALDERAALGVSIDDICLTQRPALDSYLHVHYDAWSSIPTNVLQIGLTLGTTVNKHLVPAAARVSIGAFASRTSNGKTDRSLTVNIAILATTTLFPAVFDEF